MVRGVKDLVFAEEDLFVDDGVDYLIPKTIFLGRVQPRGGSIMKDLLFLKETRSFLGGIVIPKKTEGC